MSAPAAEPRGGRSVIGVHDVTKKFRLYDERNQMLKATIMRGRRARYEEFLALDGVSVEIREGQTVGFIGENGSGKSTLLKCIARILRPDQGSISVDGRISALLELGAGFHPELSGRENVYLNGSILGLSKKELDRKFDDIVGFAGLERFIDTPVKNYSSGMYVRLGFSVAISVNPDILLVDEVLAVGDEAFQQKCGEKFAELRNAGKTIVIVSHGLAAVRAMCDDVVWLEHGKVRDSGRVGEIIDAYTAQAHHSRQADDGVGARWGTGEATIEHMEVLGADGQPTSTVCTGDRVTLRLHVNAAEPVANPVFGMSLQTMAGVIVSGPNTLEADVLPSKLHGAAVVDLVIDRLLLLPGTYDVSATICDRQLANIFDFRQRNLRFLVEAGQPHEVVGGGLTSLGGHWALQGIDGA